MKFAPSARLDSTVEASSADMVQFYGHLQIASERCIGIVGLLKHKEMNKE